MRQLGDAAVLLDAGGGYREAYALARTIQARDVIPGATTVGVIGPATHLDNAPRPPESVTHEVPIVLDGEDLAGLGLGESLAPVAVPNRGGEPVLPPDRQSRRRQLGGLRAGLEITGGARLRALGDLLVALIPSHAVVPGAIQLPPGGEPVILGPDCGPVGGYPVAATVITADLWRIGMLTPGEFVEIDLVSLVSAENALGQLARVVETACSGWYPTSFA